MMVRMYVGVLDRIATGLPTILTGPGQRLRSDERPYELTLIGQCLRVAPGDGGSVAMLPSVHAASG